MPNRRLTSSQRYKRAVFGAALFLGGVVMAPPPSDAAVIGPRAVTPPSGETASQPPTGKRLLKARKNALNGGLENLRQLREYFDEVVGNRERIVARAERLMQSLSPGSLSAPENGADAADAAMRVASVASLAMRAGTLFDVPLDPGYRLPRGAIGWDFGAEGAPVHIGFTPVAPGAVTLKRDLPSDGVTIAGDTALSDGINGLDSFETSLPNGLYRILIVADPSANDEAPFADGITINGAPLRLADSKPPSEHAPQNDAGEQLASADPAALRQTVLGFGIEGWAIVEDGRLHVDFNGLRGQRAIAAIVAEPFDLQNLELDPRILESLSDTLTDLAPAAGPEANAPRRRGGTSGTSITGGVGNVAVSRGAGQGRPAGPPSNFASRRGLPASPAFAAPATTASASTANASTDPFDALQILAQRGGSSDGTGLAIDLGALLDTASDTGTFLCTQLPCAAESFALIDAEPDLTAAVVALGDWLNDPDNLPDGWEDAQTVFENWAPGSEIAAIYSFGVDTELWTDVELRANGDDGLLVWLDGVFVFGATGPGDAADERGFDYRISLPDLAGGLHVLQIIAESRGPDSPALTFELRGQPTGNTVTLSAAAPVSEPGTLALFGVGVFGLLALRRRTRAIH